MNGFYLAEVWAWWLCAVAIPITLAIRIYRNLHEPERERPPTTPIDATRRAMPGMFLTVTEHRDTTMPAPPSRPRRRDSPPTDWVR